MQTQLQETAKESPLVLHQLPDDSGRLNGVPDWRCRSASCPKRGSPDRRPEGAAARFRLERVPGPSGFAANASPGSPRFLHKCTQDLAGLPLTTASALSALRRPSLLRAPRRAPAEPTLFRSPGPGPRFSQALGAGDRETATAPCLPHGAAASADSNGAGAATGSGRLSPPGGERHRSRSPNPSPDRETPTAAPRRGDRRLSAVPAAPPAAASSDRSPRPAACRSARTERVEESPCPAPLRRMENSSPSPRARRAGATPLRPMRANLALCRANRNGRLAEAELHLTYRAAALGRTR